MPILEKNWECFLINTQIICEDGKIPICNIVIGSRVLSYGRNLGGCEDKNGGLVSACVTRIFTNEVNFVLDFHGTGVTPGHVYLCGGGRFEGEFAPLINILRTDGALVDAEGNLLRAATKQPVDGPMDQPVQVVATGGPFGPETGLVRTGTLIEMDGAWVSVAALIEQAGGTLLDDGKVRISGRAEPVPLLLPVNHVPKPEDYVLAMSDVTLAEIYDAGEWEAMGPQLPPPEAALTAFAAAAAGSDLQHADARGQSASMLFGGSGAPLATGT